MHKTGWLLTAFALVALCGCNAGSSGGGSKGSQTAKPLAGKKVLMVIAAKNFRDEELKEPRDVLQKAGAVVTLASSTLDEARGMLGTKAKPEILVKEAKASDYDAVVFVGGQGATEYFTDSSAHKLAQDAVQEGKVLGAICYAPVILANAGVLKGKRATCFESLAQNLKDKGAVYRKQSPLADGKIVTADGPKSASSFGYALKTALSK